MVKCKECGFDNSDGSIFCGACGNKLTVECPECGGSVSLEFSFCPKCGTRINKTGEEAAKGISMLNDSVVAGDVSIDTSVHNNVVTNNYSTVNNVFNDSLVQCCVCSKNMIKGSAEVKRCSHCGNHFCEEHFVSDAKLCNKCLDDAYNLMLKKQFSDAFKIYKNAIDEGCAYPDIYYYASICLLDGKKAFIQKKAVIDQIVEYMEAAVNISEKGIYRYFLSYIKYDYYERKYLNLQRNYKVELQMAQNAGISSKEIEFMYYTIGVERPSRL